MPIRSTETDRHGAFRFDEVPFGRYDVATSSGEFLATVVTGAQSLIVRMNQLNWRHLRLVGPKGDAVHAASVSLRSAHACWTGVRISGAIVRVSPAIWSSGVAHMAVYDANGEADRQLPFGASVITLPEVLEPMPDVHLPVAQSVAGRVIDARGRPLRGATVTARFSERGFDDTVSRTTTSADGSFELTRLSDQLFRLDVDAGRDHVQTDARTARGGQSDLVVELADAAVGDLSVVDSEDRPLPGALIEVIAVKASDLDDHRSAIPVSDVVPICCVRTDEAGRARVDGIAPDTRVRIVITSPPNRDDLATWSEDPWLPRDLHVRLEQSSSIRGVVVDSIGRAMSGARVYGASRGGSFEIVDADDRGRFAFGRLRRGGTIRLCAAPWWTTRPPSSASWTTVVAGDDAVLVVEGLDSSRSR